MKYLSVILAACFWSGAACAETWLCQDSTGRRYKVSQNVLSDSCKELKESELSYDSASIDLPKRSNPKWGIEAFCKGRRTGVCEASNDALERGVLDGIWFRLFVDSAVVAGVKGHTPDSLFERVHWNVDCSKDKMSSVRSCMIKKNDLYIFVSQTGKISVSVGYEHFPGSRTSIKIGSKRFDTFDRDGEFANGKGLVALMRNDVPIVTRYMKWPYRSWVDDEFTAYGMDTAVQVARWIILKSDM